MNQDYQMIDLHVEEALRKKIISFEYIDFSKLIARNRMLKEDDQRLEIVSCNGHPFLSPMADRENVNITSYVKWEQALRVFSNILTSQYPYKSPKLLQYNHTIHTASMSYHWENVYSYDREFRHHISRHPTRSWGVILQQAWTMILKDRIKSDNGLFPERIP